MKPMEENKCIMPEEPYCPACPYGVVIPDDYEDIYNRFFRCYCQLLEEFV